MRRTWRTCAARRRRAGEASGPRCWRTRVRSLQTGVSTPSASLSLSRQAKKLKDSLQWTVLYAGRGSRFFMLSTPGDAKLCKYFRQVLPTCLSGVLAHTSQWWLSWCAAGKSCPPAPPHTTPGPEHAIL